MAATCINCGVTLSALSGDCSSCKAPVIGATIAEKAPVLVGQSVRVPGVCCCCMEPKEVDAQTQVYVGYKRYIHVPVPWCRACRSRNNVFMALLLGLMFGVGGGGIAIVLAIDSTAYGIGTLVFIGGLIAGAIAAVRIGRLMNRPGHVPRCNAVGSMMNDAFDKGGQTGGHLVFGNRVFARQWAALNAGK